MFLKKKKHFMNWVEYQQHIRALEVIKKLKV